MSDPAPVSTPDHAEENLGELIDNVVPTRGYAMVPLVGLGGSAGAIPALRAFLANVPPDCGVAFVVVMHLSSEHESILADLLQRATPMRVLQVQHTRKVERNHVYVIPPGKSLKTADGHLRLAALEVERGRRMAVDLFFRTLADTHGPHAAAVVLSGGDGDGAVGIKRIKERGGLTVAQDPQQAEHPSMPAAAIATGMVDWVLPVEHMAARLLDYFGIEHRLQLPPEDGPSPVVASTMPDLGPEEASLRDVLGFLQTRTGRDFSYYKRATILRRIARRMQVNGVTDLPGYLDCLRTRPGEAGALLQDLLISVTNFFRDADCFAALATHLPALFQGKAADDAVRVWVPACATGEEAYSIAMLLAEHARTLPAPPAIQIFATDLDENAVRTARDGLYPSTISADVSEERLQRFFLREPGGYRVRRELRETVLFAAHDLLKDSPFLRLDLLSCRNLLIYLDRTAQLRAFEILHFALRPHGRLFLGASETIDEGTALFTVLDKRHHIYAPRPGSGQNPPLLRRHGASGWTALDASGRVAAQQGPVVAGRSFEQSMRAHARHIHSRGAPRQQHDGWGELHLRLLEQLAPPSILVNEEHEIVHLSASAGRYLQHGAGEPSRDLMRLVAPALRLELRAALYRAAQSGHTVETGALTLDGEAQAVSLRVVPVSEGGQNMALVMLRKVSPADPAAEPAPEVLAFDHEPLQRLEHELEHMKEHLRNTVKDYEESTAELQASNEELQAINEEMRSTTEELETSREELQSINEELTTVNQELKDKLDELAHANSDIQNLMDATDIATIFLDRELRITRYTPSAVALFKLIPGDLGRPLSDLAPQLPYSQLGEDAARVLERLAPIEREVGQDDGRWFLARLLPYRTTEDRIAGVVLSFIDITERKRAEEVSRWLSAVVASSRDAIVSFSLEGTVLSWNPGAQRVFGYTSDEMAGQPLTVLADAGGEMRRARIVERIAAGENIENLETVHRAKAGHEVWVSLSVSPITDAHGNIVGGTAIARDIGDARRAAEALRRSEERLRLVLENARDYAILSMDLELRITSWNPGAEALIGYTEAEAVGQSMDIIFTPEDRAAGAPALEAEKALAEGRAADERFHMRRDGSRFWGSGTLMRMVDDAGQALGFVKILRDNTAAREAQAQLQKSRAELVRALRENEKARADLETADAAKDRFLAILSHELRNPLAAVSSAAALLAGEATPEDERRRAARVVQRQASTMKVLLDDLLDVSRLAMGRLKLHRQEVELAEVLDAALETARPLIEGARHRLMLTLPRQPVRVNVDALRIGQAIVNLLANAAKYTPPGGELRLAVTADASEVVLSVTDNGIGMAPEIIERMFDLYTQGPVAAFGMNEGLGVGLALVRTIAELHGGRVQARSDGAGRGSTFCLRLPVVRPQPQQAAPAAPPAETEASAAPPRWRVLIADDNLDAGWALARLLEAAGHRTVLTGGGEEALECARREAPDVVILDIGMPDLNGIEVARRLRADPQGAATLLVALTGWGSENDQREALENGFDAYLSKPVDIKTLLGTLAREMTARQPSRPAD